MDSIDLLAALEGNMGKSCDVTLKDDKRYNGVYAGTYHDGYGCIMMRLENKAGNRSFPHTEIQSILFYE